MNECVVKSEALALMCLFCKTHCTSETDAKECSQYQAMKRLLPAKVKEDIHGHWIYKGRDKGWECSVCHSLCLLDYESEFYTSEFCPHCGADMKKGENNAVN